ncbi:hypothetical protein MTR_2g049355 [Medicago truncatula]|uniref:Uncharacterized protein n=1 Tax=Medicago truncatula TaxID=3880 RepID=A0A072VI75_MEDTR|nr:hypothetical protein MTR_2g049355 [Medicago truncatula]
MHEKEIRKMGCWGCREKALEFLHLLRRGEATGGGSGAVAGEPQRLRRRAGDEIGAENGDSVLKTAWIGSGLMNGLDSVVIFIELNFCCLERNTIFCCLEKKLTVVNELFDDIDGLTGMRNNNGIPEFAEERDPTPLGECSFTGENTVNYCIGSSCPFVGTCRLELTEHRFKLSFCQELAA